MLQLEFKPYILKKKHVFRISGSARTETPLVLTRIKYNGVEGLGEASMPPLYGETIDTATDFLAQVDLSGFKSPFEIESILQKVDHMAPGHTAAKASVDIALHDLVGKLLGIPLYQYLGVQSAGLATSKTVGIADPADMQEKVQEAKSFHYLKIKLGTDDDKEIIKAVREVSDQPLYIDANQGWCDRRYALNMVRWLNQQNVILVEQPMPKEDLKGQAWLKERSPLPIIGDEAIQRLADVVEAPKYYHGINIKLMKATGIHEARKMVHLAQALGLKILLGCMSETSCAITAAAHLGAYADWIDLDGNLSVTNDPYQASKVEDGKIRLSKRLGIGLEKYSWENL